MSARRVPMLDLRRMPADLREELDAAFRRVVDGGQYILGPEVEALEAECAAYLGAAHAVGVSSGTDALLASLMALGVGPGDEVVCPTFTFFATAGGIARLGATPVFVDASLEHFGCEPAEVAARVTPRTRALVPVHLFGQCVDVPALRRAAAGLPIVEDAAQAIGARAGGERAGAMGTLAAFSFFPSKNLGALGDAGLVTTGDPALAERVRLLRAHGAKPKYHHALVGGNFRLDALQAALLRPRLRRLDAWTARRQAHAARYAELFAASGVAAPNRAGARAPVLYPVATTERHVFHQYCLRVTGGRRDALRAHLHERGVGTEVYYPLPMHLQECFAGLGYRRGALPNAERLADEALAIPIFPELRDEELEHVVECVRGFFG